MTPKGVLSLLLNNEAIVNIVIFILQNSNVFDKDMANNQTKKRFVVLLR